jgi:RuvC nuclease domain/Alpha helical recognition lobe domain
MPYYDNLLGLNKSIKTLKFGLKPTTVTNQTLKNQGQIETDTRILDVYQRLVKPAYDNMHQKFITEALEKVTFEKTDLEDMQEIQIELLEEKDKAKKSEIEKELDKIKSRLKQNIGVGFVNTAKVWVTNNPDMAKTIITDDTKLKDALKILTTKGSLELIKVNKLTEEDDFNEIKTIFSNFFTYLNNFNTNRMNYYNLEKENNISYRTVDDNLARFIKNNHLIDEKLNSKISTINPIGLLEYRNHITQSGITEYNDIIANHNLVINKYNQDNKEKLPKLQMLYKQIGSISDSTDKEIFMVFKPTEVKTRVEELKNNQKELIKSAALYFNNDFFVKQENLDKIYLNTQGLTSISHEMFLSWNTLAEIVLKLKKSKSKDEFKIPKYISLSELKEAIDNIDPKINHSAIFKNVEDNAYVDKSKWETFWAKFRNSIDLTIKTAQTELIENGITYNIEKSRGKIELKTLCDSLLNVERLINKFRVEDVEQDSELLGLIYEFECGLIKKEKNLIIQYYNAFRSLVSKRPQDLIEKQIKLNFDSSYFLTSFGNNFDTKEAMVLKKDNLYYLCIVNGKGIKKNDLIELKSANPDSHYLETSFVKPDAKNLSRMFLYSKGTRLAPNAMVNLLEEKHTIEGQQLTTKSIIEKKLFSVTSNRKGFKPYLDIVINYYFQCLRNSPSFKVFDLKLNKNLNFENLNQFCDHMGEQCYQINWLGINWAKLENLEKEERLLIFKIDSKDFNIGVKGKLNKQTYMFLAAMDPKTGPTIRIAGNGKVLYRPKLNSLKFKNDNTQYHNRYLENKYLLHFPVSCGLIQDLNFNETINKEIRLEKDIHVIGLDRGEKNLAYYSIINSKGEIIEKGQKDLNVITHNGRDQDYHELLTTKAGNMMEARQNWQTIGNIKNLKDGYMSQVIHEIYQLMLKHNAVLALEDLNSGFMVNRTAKVEKSLYKKFETNLAKSLSSISIKSIEKGSSVAGSIINPYNLTQTFDKEYFDNAKQWGSILFVKAAYTSQIDPITGWRKFNIIDDDLKTKIENNEIVIDFDSKLKCYTLSYKVKDYSWKMIFHEDVKRTKRVKKDNKPINIFTDLKTEITEVFNKVNINPSQDIQKQIIELNSLEDSKFLASLSWLLRLASKIRNTDENGIDYICSPVWSDKLNGFYDSRKASEYKTKYSINLPIDSDANGAFNIAKKGLMLVKRIKESKPGDKIDYYISEDQWDENNIK